MRPRPPPSFAAAVRRAEKAVRAAVAAGRAPPFEEEIWQSQKGAFIEAQLGKCGYCEQYSQNHPGAVDHHSPKGSVTELVAEGVEIPASRKVRKAKPKGRKTRPISATGYFWLAYRWGNWLFVCNYCNSGWKGCLFPIREVRRRLPPRPGRKETPLLLSPFGRVDPIHHLRFSRIGQIGPRDGSDRGDATIRTCGLDRETLRRSREGIAGDAYRHVDRLVSALNQDNLERAGDAVADLLSLGGEERAHAGMVRSIVSLELRYRWADLERLQDRLIVRSRRRHP